MQGAPATSHSAISDSIAAVICSADGTTAESRDDYTALARRRHEAADGRVKRNESRIGNTRCDFGTSPNAAGVSSTIIVAPSSRPTERWYRCRVETRFAIDDFDRNPFLLKLITYVQRQGTMRASATTVRSEPDRSTLRHRSQSRSHARERDICAEGSRGVQETSPGHCSEARAASGPSHRTHSTERRREAPAPDQTANGNCRMKSRGGMAISDASAQQDWHRSRPLDMYCIFAI